MDVVAHTTPESRMALKDYFRNRRLTGSYHLVTARIALSDLDRAIQLLQGVHHPSTEWVEDVERYLSMVQPVPAPDPSLALPGLLVGQ